MKLPRTNNNNLCVLIHRGLSSNGKNGSDSSGAVGDISNGVKAIASEKVTQIVDSVKQNMTSSVQFVDDTLGATEVSMYLFV